MLCYFGPVDFPRGLVTLGSVGILVFVVVAVYDNNLISCADTFGSIDFQERITSMAFPPVVMRV